MTAKSHDERVQPEVRDLTYPALLITTAWIAVYANADALTVSWKRTIENKRYEGSLLVDSAGKARSVKGVRSTGSVGSFWGFDRFLNRTMRISFDFEGDWRPADLEDIRQRCLKKWKVNGESTDPEFESEYAARLESALDVRSLVATLVEQYGTRYERY